MVLAALKLIGKVLGGLLLLLVIYIVYMSWLEKRKEKAFASCKLDYLTLERDARDDQQQYNYLRACMGKSGYSERIDRYCVSYSDFTSGDRCFTTGFLP